MHNIRLSRPNLVPRTRTTIGTETDYALEAILAPLEDLLRGRGRLKDCQWLLQLIAALKIVPGSLPPESSTKQHDISPYEQPDLLRE